MIIAHLGGSIQCKNYEELKDVMMIRYGACLNTFILGLDDGRPYPCLNISVNNKYANIVYLPDDESAGSQSIGNGTDLKLNESTNFCMGFVTELYECSNEYVVLFEQAQDRRFYRVQGSPQAG